MAFMPRPVWRVEPRSWPAGRSGCVTRPTTGWGPASKASTVGSANVPVPIITRRMVPRPLAASRDRSQDRRLAAGGRRRLGGRVEQLLLQCRQLLQDLLVGRQFAALAG